LALDDDDQAPRRGLRGRHLRDHHSGTLATRAGQINPYKLGVELFGTSRSAGTRGSSASEWESCDDPQSAATGHRRDEGREKIFQVRKHHNDVSFVDEFVDAEFAEDQKLYVYGRDQRPGST
jgi:stage V sporulation protein R